MNSNNESVLVGNAPATERILGNAERWVEGLRDRAIESASHYIEQHGAPSPVQVFETLAGEFDDPIILQEVLLEAVSSFKPFAEMLEDPRLDAGKLERETIAEAAVAYDAVLAGRIGLKAGRAFSAEAIATRTNEKVVAWAESLSVGELLIHESVSSWVVRPEDVVELLRPSFTDPEIAPHIVRQCVEEARSCDEMLAALKEWGSLEDLTPLTTARIHRCYNALMATDLGVDLEAVQARRLESETEIAKGVRRAEHQEAEHRARKHGPTAPSRRHRNSDHHGPRAPRGEQHRQSPGDRWQHRASAPRGGPSGQNAR